VRKKVFLLFLILFAVIIAAVAYLVFIKGYRSQVAENVPPLEESESKEATATPLVTDGTVSGKLCFPSDFLPPGEIIAKNTETSETYTQNYIGTSEGGALTYEFALPEGIYHLKYQAHANFDRPDVFTSGYYDECAKTMATAECTPDSGHININVIVSSGVETTDVDLCDFYYNPAQVQSLENGF